MPRNISFALTTSQFCDGSKTVTRRMGWKTLKAGDVLRAVEKSQGLKKGEKVKPLGLIRVVSAKRERLQRLIGTAYGDMEATREGFPNMRGAKFVEFFCTTHDGCQPNTWVTRIEFERIAG